MRESVVGKIQIEAPSLSCGFRSERDESPLNSTDGVSPLLGSVSGDQNSWVSLVRESSKKENSEKRERERERERE